MDVKETWTDEMECLYQSASKRFNADFRAWQWQVKRVYAQ